MSENLDFRVSREAFRTTMTIIIDIKCLERHCVEHAVRISQSEFYTNWEVDSLKKSLQSWWSQCAFSIYRRHFQLQFFSRSFGRWCDVPYDCCIIAMGKSKDQNKAPYDYVPRRETAWNFRAKLNEGSGQLWSVVLNSTLKNSH